jgi:hypothetical protein
MRSGLRLLVFAVSLFSGACSLVVSFDDPAEPTCDMVPPDCSVEACLLKPECAPVDCTIQAVYYDSPPACPDQEECIFTESEGASCVPDFYFSDGNFYDMCDQNRCPHGSVCLPGMVGSPDVCVPYCNAFSHARCPDGGRCYNTEDSATVDVCFRVDDCDPVAGKGCGDQKGCFFIPPNDTTCLPAGSKKTGERCKILWDCASGYVCSDVVTESGVCLKVCSDVTDCVAPEECSPVGIYGVCRSPAVPVK